jgi:MFS family permease
VTDKRGSSFIADLRAVLGEPDFRRLYATRLVSQTGDGIFNAGFAAYAFFSKTVFPNPAAAASAAAVLYLPYSLIGPFAGVFIDRWSRRQILVWSAAIRAVMVVISAFLVASGTLGVPLYIAVLAVLGVNRFFLSALSAALPHVVPEDKLVMANTVAPTSGTIVGFIGGVVGLGVHLVTGGGHIGSTATLLAGGVGYAAAGLIGATMPRDLLGPGTEPGTSAQRSSVRAEMAVVAAGLAAGARHLWQRRQALYALVTIGAHRFLYGILLLMSVLLYRNYFYPTKNGNTALGHFTLVVITSAIGYGVGAMLTPPMTRRMTKMAWVAALLVFGGVVTGLLGSLFSQVPFLILGFALGITGQGLTITVTTVLQESVAETYLGRVFALYDMMYNATFVIGAAISVAFMPLTGKSYSIVAFVACAYAAAGIGYWLVSRRSAGSPLPEPSEEVPLSPAQGQAPLR